MLDILSRLDTLDLFIDVGANVGQSLLKLKSVFPESNYFGIEPNETCSRYLEKLVDMNDLKNCVIVQKALSDKVGDGKLFFFLDEATDRSASLDQNHLNTLQTSLTQEVQLIDANHLLQLTNFPSSLKATLVKIDTERTEHLILHSFLKEEFRSVFLVEILPPNSEKDNERVDEINHLLLSNRYSLFRIMKNNLNYAGLRSMDKLSDTWSIEESDYLLIPKEKLTSFLDLMDV